MPKAARRIPDAAIAPRTEPYPATKPSDILTTSGTSDPKSESAARKAPQKALIEKRASEVNTSVPSTSDKPFCFLDIKLDGEDTDSVPIYDTCSTIRHKINSLLGKDNKEERNGNPRDLNKDGKPKPFNKTSFINAIGAGSTRSLDTFLKAKLMMGGAESAIYPAAYIFFEKKRIFEGKKKLASRLKVEEEYVLLLFCHLY